MRLFALLLAASLLVGGVAQAKAGGVSSKLRASVRNFFLSSEGSYSGLQQRLAAVAIAGVSCGMAGCTPYEALTAVAVFSPVASQAIDNKIAGSNSRNEVALTADHIVKQAFLVDPWDAVDDGRLTPPQRNKLRNRLESYDVPIGVALFFNSEYYYSVYYGEIYNVGYTDQVIDFTHWIEDDGRHWKVVAVERFHHVYNVGFIPQPYGQ